MAKLKNKRDRAAVKRWIKALRSGEYKQAHGRLRRWRNGEESFCCLGVLADIELEGTWATAFTDTSVLVLDDGTEVDSLLGPVHDNSRRAVDSLSWLSREMREELVTRNDRLRRSFKRIADFIEKELL